MSAPKTPLTPTLSPLAQGEGAPWRGSVLASGFVLDETLMERAELVKRLLGAWTDRSRLARDGTRWFLLGTTPRQVDSRACIGSPLVLAQGRWLSGPTGAEVIRATPMDSILDWVAGERRVISFSSLTPVHPSELVELELPTVLEVKLLAPPPPPVIPKRAPAPATLDTVFAPMLAALTPSAPRPELTPQPPPAPTLRQRIGAWLAARQQAAAARPPGPSLRTRVGNFFTALANRLPSLPSREGGAAPPPQLGPGRERTVREIREPPPAPREPSWLDRFARWLTPGPGTSSGSTSNAPMQPLDPGLLAQLAQWFAANPQPAPPPRDPPPRPRVEEPGWLTRAFRNFFAPPKPQPDKQRDYLEDLRRRFQLGDLSEALRRAIPLGGSSLGAPTGALPARRDNLSLFTPNAVGAPSMVMQNDEYAEMRKLYRESADKLIAEGKIEEAAYVLAKLLNDGAAAVALLEKHGKLELAAQLATAQHLPEVDRIRLWLLAGKKEEAIRIARGSTDFGLLVQTLTTRAPELAKQLRGVWGEFLADRQRYTEAIVVTAPLTETPTQWDEWVNRSLEAGGASAVTALAVDSSRHPDNAQQTRERVSALLAGDERVQLTTAAADAFLKHAPSTKNGPLFRELWRKLMRGASSGQRVDRGLADRVMRMTSDQTLAVDAVASAPMALGAREPLELTAPVVPGLPIFDVAPLPKGRRAVALGSAGLRIESSSGETIRHQLVKADLLVAGPVGVGVLVLSLDGELTRVWKLDPRTLELTSWFQASLSAFSRRYDGLCWGVGMERALVFLDPSAATPMEWWRVPNIECREIDANGSRIIALATELGLKESWRYIFNAGAERMQIRYPPNTEAWARGDTALPWELARREDALLELRMGAQRFPLATGRWSSFAMEPGVVLVRTFEGNTEVLLAEWSGTLPRLLARLSRTSRVRCRDLSATLLALCDEHGRVTELELS